jgi:hypothetical protein
MSNTTTKRDAHTPGPWAVCANDCCRVNVAQGVMVNERQADDVTICQTDGGGPFEDDDSDAVRANAVLIAAAPTMLDALRSAVASLEQLVRINRIPASNAGLRDARRAIALATGGTVEPEATSETVSMA